MGSGGGRPVSTAGGVEPRWPRRGTELFYIAPNNMLMTVPMKLGLNGEAGLPQPLFPARPTGVLRYDASADGQRFLVSTPTDQTTYAPATVVLNWRQALAHRSGVTRKWQIDRRTRASQRLLRDNGCQSRSTCSSGTPRPSRRSALASATRRRNSRSFSMRYSNQSSSEWNPINTPAGRPWRVITISSSAARRR